MDIIKTIFRICVGVRQVAGNIWGLGSFLGQSSPLICAIEKRRLHPCILVDTRYAPLLRTAPEIHVPRKNQY
jgi:hypothetical protein